MDRDKIDEGNNDLLRRLEQTTYIPEEWLTNKGRKTEELSQQHLRVLQCLSHGLTIPMIAETLGISEHTAADHVSAIRFKLRAKNSAHAVANAFRKGILK